MQFPAGHRFTIFFYMHSVPFTEAVLTKQSSLGGSESACRVLAEGLAGMGHSVHMFVTQFLPELKTEDAKVEIVNRIGRETRVVWHDAEDLPEVLRFESPDVFVSLRMPDVFRMHVPAKLRILWNQDLLTHDGILGQLYAIDRAVFVSEYHLEQWCQRAPMLRPLSSVTKNPFDPRDLIMDDGRSVLALPKVRDRFIHISRPERGLDGLLHLWPQIRKRIPTATLRLCRYDSMYDRHGWGEVCAQYDRKVEAINARVGGIEYLGNLNKRQLYQEIAQAVAMLYPTSQPNFAETNCIAATEAQACGTPFVGSWRGALPETLGPGAGVLIDGDVVKDAQVADRWLAAAEYFATYSSDPDAVLIMDGVEFGTYEEMRQAGVAFSAGAHGDVVAAEWDLMLRELFESRFEQHKLGVLRQLLHWDNHGPALALANDFIVHRTTDPLQHDPDLEEMKAAAALCERVIRQEEQTAEHYAQYAIQDPAIEAQGNKRLQMASEAVLASIRDIEHPLVIDLACGNGSFSLLLLRAHPTVEIIAVDYSPGVLEIAKRGIEAEGFGSDRIMFLQGQWNADERTWTAADRDVRVLADGKANAVFCGEFLEHIERPGELLDYLETLVDPSQRHRIVLTTPCGPFAELLSPGIPRQRGHVHAFSLRDIMALCEPKEGFGWQYIGIGHSPRGTSCGYWMLAYRAGGQPAGQLDYTHTILTERPYQRLHAMMIMRNELDWIAKCLRSIQQVVDEVFIYDTGSTDGGIDLAQALGAKVTCGEWPNHFGEARNRALDLAEPGAEWVMWIDADEHVDNPARLRHFIVDGGPYVGYVLHQQHIMADAKAFFDQPVRVFRTGHGIKFYGDVHEQPEIKLNEGISPALDQTDVKLVHFGYENEAIRKHKMLQRNLPLLMRAVRAKSPRELDYVHYMRELMNVSLFDLKEKQTSMTALAYKYCLQAIQVYDDHFASFDHRCHKLVWPFYQQALRMMGNHLEVKWGFLAAHGAGSLEGKQPTGETFLARSTAEAEAVIAHRTRTWFTELRGPYIDVEPVTNRLALLRGPHGKLVEDALREAADASFDDPARVRAWLGHLVDCLVEIPGHVLEIGTWKGATALAFARIMAALAPHHFLVTVDPYGDKPYQGIQGEHVLFGDKEYVAMRTRLAPVAKHVHFKTTSAEFLDLAAQHRCGTWNEGTVMTFSPFSFVLVDGDHDAASVMADVHFLMDHDLVRRGGIVIVDNVNEDPSTMAQLAEAYDATFVDAKWGQRFAVIQR